jgi:hypothetical protein
MAVRLSALSPGCPFLPGIFLVLISARGWIDPQGHSAGGRIRSIEKYNYLIGARTRDLLACSIVPQVTTLPRVSMRAGMSGLNSWLGQETFLYSTVSRPTLGPTQSPIKWVSGAFPPGMKRPGHEADHSPLSNAEFKNGVAIPPLPLTSSWRGG